ncbi:hypothetical protein [Polyangium mundeleinium]|uniref:DUF4240 domain-containing protein n=1 Tax=Polyangium mundeleinium TaxID=2995306 RepID=A0ABT5F5W8_9BACT|nr:hypothetical protein [Polyangium mundeleinium]MDC0749494.1 hypothetical protein [Polyangium mundeleinium]
MMLAWSFSARTLEEIERLLRALGKHRYVREVDHRIHWTVDRALADLPAFAPHAQAFAARRSREKGLEVASRDPSLWRSATADDVCAVFRAFWTPGESAERYKQALRAALAETGLPPANHEPFEASADEPPHPELVLLDWELFPVDELDADRHRGALEAMEEAGEEVDASAPVFQEGPILAAPELFDGAPGGELREDFFVWSDGPYSYSDYVFRGAAKVAKLAEPPVGYNDIE